jgi:alpha-beta hydrolase superfamily lysophospholipase
MQHSSAVFKASDNFLLHTETWLPDSPPRAVVLFSHGIAEHIGRYPHVAAAFAEAGVAFYGLDHRTHGKSAGHPRVYFEDFQTVIDDLYRYLEHIQAQQPGVPIFLYGHSLGSLIAEVFALQHQLALAGLIVTGTPLAVEDAQPRLLVLAAGFLNWLLPTMAIAKPVPGEALSTDLRVGEAYETDQMVHHGDIAVRMGYHLLEQGRLVKKLAGDLRLPLLIMHGAADTICPPAGSQLLFDRAGSADKILHFWPGMRHEIHNEMDKAAVLEMAVGWVLERC